MKLDVPQKVIGSISLSILDNILNNIVEEDWLVDDYRNSAGNMSDTNSIPIHHTTQCVTGKPTMEAIKSIKKEKLYPKFFPLIEPVLNELKNYFEFNQYAAFLSRVRPGGVIGTHPDSGAFLELCHRIHVPLQTSPLVKYIIDGKSYYWEKGKIYEFDNALNHSVENHDPSIWRIHLVINLYNLTEEQLKKD